MAATVGPRAASGGAALGHYGRHDAARDLADAGVSRAAFREAGGDLMPKYVEYRRGSNTPAGVRHNVPVPWADGRRAAAPPADLRRPEVGVFSAAREAADAATLGPIVRLGPSTVTALTSAGISPIVTAFALVNAATSAAEISRAVDGAGALAEPERLALRLHAYQKLSESALASDSDAATLAAKYRKGLPLDSAVDPGDSGAWEGLTVDDLYNYSDDPGFSPGRWRTNAPTADAKSPAPQENKTVRAIIDKIGGERVTREMWEKYTSENPTSISTALTNAGIANKLRMPREGRGGVANLKPFLYA